MLISLLFIAVMFFLWVLDVYEQLKTQLWEDDAVTGLCQRL